MTSMPSVDELDDHVELPILGEAPLALWEAARGGQPVLLTREGAPALVVLDVDSYREAELAAQDVPVSSGRWPAGVGPPSY